MRKLPVFLILQLLFFSSLAQSGKGRAMGTVKDNEGKIQDAVTISIFKSKDSSLIKIALSDKNGAFLFENIPFGSYFLSASHVGYANQNSKVFELSAVHLVEKTGELLLNASRDSLTAVTVTFKKPLIENRIDKTIVNVDASPTNAGLTALEVLEKSPGVTVDNDGNISLKGKQGVVIMIDGKPTYLGPLDLANYLKNMPSNQLDQVEIMSQPPAKYDAAGNSGVINIITKKNKAAGFNGSVTTSAIIAKYFKNTNSFTFNWSKGKVNVYGNYGYSYWEGFNTIDIEKSLRENASVNFDRYTTQNTFGRYSDRGQTFRAGVDYFASRKSTFGFSVNGTVDKESFTSSSTSNIYDSLHQFVQYNNAQSQNKTPETHLGFNANYMGKLDDKGSEISIDADYIFYNTQGSAYSNNYLYNSDNIPSEDPYLLNGLLPSYIDIYSLKADYKKILKNQILLEAGVKSSFVKTDNDAAYALFNNSKQQWESDSTISNHFVYRENINAAYVNWQQQIKKINMQLGLRAEQTSSLGDQTIKNVNFKRNYFQIFPTAYVTYKPDDNSTYGISFGRRIERPGYQSLNPFRFQLDRYNYEEGNPNLLPQFSNNVELSYNYKGLLNVSANYSMTTDIISDVVLTVKEPLDSNYTTIQTSQNIASQRNIGLSVGYTKQMTKAWTLNVFFNLYNNYYVGVVDSTNIHNGFTSFNANFNTQYAFKKGWTAEMSGFYYAKDYVSSVNIADGRGMFSLGASKQILKGKGSIKLNLRDPLYLMSFTGYSNLDKGVTRAHYVWDNRRMIFTFVYRFGKTNGGQSQRRTSGASDEQNRVGGGNGQQ